MFLICIFKLVLKMANLNDIIEFSLSFCTKFCTYEWEHFNLNTEIHCHFTYYIAIFHIKLILNLATHMLPYIYIYFATYKALKYVFNLHI